MRKVRESLRPLARAVGGGCAGAVRWERLPRVLEAEKPVGCRQTSIFCLDGCSPTGSAGSNGQNKAGFSGRSPIFPGDLPGFAGKSVAEKCLKQIQNREFVILGQNRADICYGLGDSPVKTRPACRAGALREAGGSLSRAGLF